MQSAATTVTSYLEDQPDDWKPVLRKLRAACRRELRGAKEEMRHGMPSYVRDGEMEVAFAKQVQYLSLYLPPAVSEAHREELAGVSRGKSCIRFRRPDQIDWDVVSRLLADTRKRA
jgi:uncharacterized protein YdhG (YjbR/CyaY superfamily)